MFQLNLQPGMKRPEPINVSEKPIQKDDHADRMRAVICETLNHSCVSPRLIAEIHVA